MARKKMVFACSGACGSGQMANWLAARLDGEKSAEMGCALALAVGNAELLQRARTAPAVIAIDACGEACMKKCLEKQDVPCTHHFNLLQWGVRKTGHADFDSHEAQELYEALAQALARRDRQSCEAAEFA